MMVPDTYALLERAIEEGLVSGIHRFNKHRPSEQQISELYKEDIVEALTQAAMNSICEVFKFPEVEK